MSAMASQITSLSIVDSTVYSRRRSKKTSKLRVTGLCEWNSPVTCEFSAQMASNAQNVSIWWRHHGMNSVHRSWDVLNNINIFAVFTCVNDYYNSFSTQYQWAFWAILASKTAGRTVSKSLIIIMCIIIWQGHEMCALCIKVIHDNVTHENEIPWESSSLYLNLGSGLVISILLVSVIY